MLSRLWTRPLEDWGTRPSSPARARLAMLMWRADLRNTGLWLSRCGALDQNLEITRIVSKWTIVIL